MPDKKLSKKPSSTSPPEMSSGSKAKPGPHFFRPPQVLLDKYPELDPDKMTPEDRATFEDFLDKVMAAIKG